MTADEQQRAVRDGLTLIDQAGQLLTCLALHLQDDPDTARIGVALDGVGVVLARAEAVLGPLDP